MRWLLLEGPPATLLMQVNISERKVKLTLGTRSFQMASLKNHASDEEFTHKSILDSPQSSIACPPTQKEGFIEPVAKLKNYW
jgi:hypothetical protein